MFTILVILALIYAALKFSNTRAEFQRRDAERAREEQEAQAAMEEFEEEEEIRRAAVDVDAEVVEDAAEFEVQPADDADEVIDAAEIVDVAEFEVE